MLYISFGGRLGNQFLTYAFAKSLWLRRGREEKMVFSFPHFTQEEIDDGFENVLDYFKVNDHAVVGSGNLVLRCGSIFLKLFYPIYLLAEKMGHKRPYIKKWAKRWYKRLPEHGVYRNYNEMPVYCSQKNKIFIVGLCTNPECFNSVKEELVRDFEPKMPPRGENSDLYEIINNTNSVCVSIRRGDYVTKFKKDFFLCDENYFKKAIGIIKERIPNPVIVFFSDDINWVRDNIQVDLPCYYESGDDPIWEKLRLMYSCKHFVISNSTFSWWAQFLSRNENKLVISPDRWYGNKNWSSPLLQDSFVKIKME